MLRLNICFPFLLILLLSCNENSNDKSFYVKNFQELDEAISQAQAGDEIIMANGIWKDIQIRFKGVGNEENPIVLKAETDGEVFIEGESDLKLAGEYLLVRGLYFRNGYTPSKVVIDFRINDKEFANNSRVTECAIINYNQLQRNRSDHWVEFWGRNNKMDHCYISGKSNEGPTIRVRIAGNEHIRNYHEIVDNHFGPRPRKGGPKAETIQLGTSETSMAPSYTLVANNFFEKCNGEVEVISSKSNFNEFKKNIFYKSEGSLVMRHGNYCVIDGNYFIGDEGSNNIGGIRIINTGHWVINNYFYNLKGENFRSPLAIMNGIPKSPLNRYNQVTDVVVAYNTWVNCKSPIQFGVGANLNEKDVLPPSEIRSARPIRTIVANNIIYNEVGDPQPLVTYDSIDGVTFMNNYINNQDVAYNKLPGFEEVNFNMVQRDENLYVPAENSIKLASYKGFDFEKINEDILGNTRDPDNSVGAFTNELNDDLEMFDLEKYGPSWFEKNAIEKETQTLTASPSEGDLEAKLSEAKEGDIIKLEPGIYSISQPLEIKKKIQLISLDKENKAHLQYSGPKETPLFKLYPYTTLFLEDVQLSGDGSQYAFTSLHENMSGLYNLYVSGAEIENFNTILKGYRHSFADEISFENSILKNSSNGLELSAEKDDKGDYNVEFLNVDNCHFENIGNDVIDYYRGGYDESTIGGNLNVSNSTFINCGAQDENQVLIDSRGIINVDISDNTFKNNAVKYIAVLWGAKNNSHSNNQITNSGEFRVEENLKLKLMY